MREEQLPYGLKDFKRMRLEGRYYADKTEYIRTLEKKGDYAFIVRPRRFGKSLFCEMLKCYYDVNEKGNFSTLFGDLAIGKNPTDQANRYCVLALDFSRVGGYPQEEWQKKFEAYMVEKCDEFIVTYRDAIAKFCDPEWLLKKTSAASKFNFFSPCARAAGLKFYVIVDEYDNFTNEIASSDGLEAYKAVTHGEGFYRHWFMQFKSACDRVFLTGVSPVTMDDLTSGFNISFNLAGDENFNGMIGFTESETQKLFEAFQGCGKFKDSAEGHLDTVKRWYDGYCFAEELAGEEFMYNCDMTLYYLSSLVSNGKPPKNLVDANIRSDWNKLKVILRAQRNAETDGGMMPLTEELAAKNEVTFPLVESFPFERIHEKENFKSLFYYYGIVTMSRVEWTSTYFKIPNECVRRQIFEYLLSEYGKMPNAVDMDEFQRRFRAFALDGEWEALFRHLAKAYMNIGSPRDGIEGEARVNGFFRAYLGMSNAFVVKPEMSVNQGYADFVLLPDRMLMGENAPKHSYVIELKYSKASAKKTELDKKHAEAVVQLARYAADPNLEKLACGTPVHFLTVEFRGKELARLEEVKFGEESR